MFFTDADCLLPPDALARACAALDRLGPRAVLGGTYTPLPADDSFFSRFQSVFIHHSETRHAADPDYLATHALALHADTLRRCHGFDERVHPILEDAEFSHRLRRAGYRLVLDPAIQVRHIFNFFVARFLRNAFTKARYWTRYSIANCDQLADIGTASHALKLNVATYFLSALLRAGAWSMQPVWFAALGLIQAVHLWWNRALLEVLPSIFCKRRPIQLIFFVTRRCNAHCPFCFYPNSASPNQNKIRKKLSAEEILRTCCKSVIAVKISLDGLHGKHDALRGSPGGFDKALGTSQRLAALRSGTPP